MKKVHKKKVFVGLSGGVDSSVSAHLLKLAGYDVTGVFIKVWHPQFLDCNWKDERRDAMRVAAQLDIPFLTFDLEGEYKREVVEYMITSYRIGETPNPDVMCNKAIKFGAFLKKAREMGADLVATGHYARIERQGDGYKLLAGVDEEKDQSYFLWSINYNDLPNVLFPVGSLKKDKVREIARMNGLFTARKKDSQGVCFIGKLNMKDFLKKYIEEKSGDVLNESGEVIGSHDGAWFYTLGQRHGFDVRKSTPNSAPYYVIKKDVLTNTLVVSLSPQRASKFKTKRSSLRSVNWLSSSEILQKELLARFRYRQKLLPCRIQMDSDGNYEVVFKDDQPSVSAGQSLVVYDDEICLGGGVIE